MKKTIKFFIIIIVALVLMFLAYNTNFTKEWILITKTRVLNLLHPNDGNTPTFSELSDNFSLNPYYDGFVIIDKNGISNFNITGTQKWDKKVTMANPLTKTSGKYLVTADLTNGHIYLFNQKTELWYKEVNGQILNLSVNDSGYVGLIYKDNNYKCILEVFDTKGIGALQRYYSNNYAICLEISNDNKTVAIGEVDTSGIKISSGVRLIDLSTKYDAGTFESDSLISNINFWDKNIIATFDNKIISIDRDMNKTPIDDIINGNIINLILTNKYIIKAEKGSLFNIEKKVSVTDKKNNVLGTYTTKDKIVSIDNQGDIIALNLGNKVEFINVYGKALGQYYPKKDVKKIHLSKDGIYAAIIYSNFIEIVNVF